MTANAHECQSPGADLPFARKQFSRLTATVAVIACMVAATPQPASADWFTYAKTDDSNASFASDESNQDHFLFWNHFTVLEQRDQYGARTDLTVSDQGRLWTNSTDFVWFAGQPCCNYVASEECRVWNGANRCDRALIIFKEDLTRQISGDAGFQLACHEFGHGYGFDHHGSSCMTNPVYLGSPYGGTLTPHMIGHINDYYN